MTVDVEVVQRAKSAVLHELPEGVVLSYYEAERIAEAVLKVATRSTSDCCPSCGSWVHVLTCHDPFHAGTLEDRTQPTREQIAKAMYDDDRLDSPNLIRWNHPANADIRRANLRHADVILRLFNKGT